MQLEARGRETYTIYVKPSNEAKKDLTIGEQGKWGKEQWTKMEKAERKGEKVI